MRYRQLGLFLVGLMLTVSAVADVLQLKEGYPETYVVKKGDTLWDISGYFLKKPWLWPRLWQVNPQVRDPHWIYPGDVLNLVWINGEPRLVSKHMRKLSPKVRVTAAEKPVPTIELARIAPFLVSSHVFGANENIDLLPYFLGNNHSQSAMMVGTDGDFIVRGSLVAGQQYAIYRPGQVLKEQESEEVLGRQADLVGIALAGESAGNHMTHAKLVKNIQEVRQGDRLIMMPPEENLNAYFPLRAGNVKKQGYVLEIPSKVSVVGKYDVVMLNVGAREGVAAGDVFNVLRPGVEVIESGGADELEYKQFASEGKKLFSGESTRLPDNGVGQLMVFKVYEKVSMAIILRTSDTIRKDFRIENP